jgi:CHAT domain-containing protein
VERLHRTFRLNLEMATNQPPADQARFRVTEHANRALAGLEQALLGGLENLTRYQSLVIVPHGIMHYLPFHAFFDGTRYLVERVAVSYAPSSALYTICRDRSRPTRRRRDSLVLAHSAGGHLPYTLDEAAAIGEVIAAPVHLESAATRALLAREGRTAGLIHIAAHGTFRPDAPLFSAVELGDGPLTTADVFNLDLRGALVTLSACETGRSIAGGGDELAGLARAFLYAGSAGLVVSQWRVEDSSTARLMTTFYELLTSGVGPAAALQSAQVASLSPSSPNCDRLHPLYWAGFQHIGA